MIRGQTGSMGGGIYFAESPEATNRKARGENKGVILKATVSLGNIKHLDVLDNNANFHDLLNEGFDSIKTNYFQSGVEYIVYNFDQVANIEEYIRVSV
jgi:hypothetical protein